MDTARRFSFFKTKSMSSLRDEARDTAIQKNERRAHRVFPAPDGGGTIMDGGRTTRDSIHSRWSSNASTVRDAGPEDRAYRRISEVHVQAYSPAIPDDHTRRANMSLENILETSPRPTFVKYPRRFAREALKSGSTESSPPELPLLRMSSFPDMMAASLSSGTPDSTPLSTSDSFTVSDSSSSFRGLVGFASEFPQPPSLSPALRRMQSAPWLKDIHQSFEIVQDESLWQRMSQATQHPTREMDVSFGSSLVDLPAFSRDTVISADASFQRRVQELKEAEGGSPLEKLRDETRKRAGAGGDLSWSRRHTYKTRTTDDLLGLTHSQLAEESMDSTRDRSSSLLGRHPARKRDGRRNTLSSVTPQDVPSLVSAEKPRTIRKVASMQSSSQPQNRAFPETSAGQRSIQKIKSLRLFPPNSYSKHDIATMAGSDDPVGRDDRDLAPTQKAKPKKWLTNLRASSSTKLATLGETQGPEGLRSRGLSLRKSMDVATGGGSLKKRISRRDRTPYPAGLTPDRQPNDHHRSGEARASRVFSTGSKHKMRQSGLGFSTYGSRSSVNVGLGLESGTAGGRLDGPFTLRKSQIYQAGDGQAADEYQAASGDGRNMSVEASMSFMDLTPERGAGKTEKGLGGEQKRDRVKKFIAKASHGFMEWGRGLGAKKHGGVASP